MDINALGIAILLILFLLWNLDFVVTLLNLRALRPEVPAEFEGIIPASEHQKSLAYARASARFGLVESLVSLSTLLVFWLIGGFGWLDSLCRSWLGDGIPAGLLFLALLFIGNHLLHLPLSIYSTFVLEERFGFNRTTPRLFITDEIKNLLLSAALGLPLLAGLLWIFQNVPQAWLWAWLLFTTVQLLLTWAAPTWILPLYNRFTPMEEGPTRSAIESMAEKCGFPLGEISVMDGSKRSTKANAYFTGFGKTKKIALYDTLVEEQTRDELVAVLAHEIGHFKCRHIIKRIAMAVMQTAVLFFLLGRVIDSQSPFARELFDAFFVPEISAHVGLVLFAILFSPVSRILSVLGNRSSRQHEFEADAYAAQVTGQPEALISALKKLSVKNLSNLTPHPARVFLDHSHPPVLIRIAALRSL
ncbi:STE24 endopeptidase [Haloferula luteola]|uniref:STE24 endopeptidase n=1 Tax=Haloferula luteola TaxID=595692 RepID=A0A840V9N4_9BACT|nr:M48 family metallopeptidase [Haloferula luteola]MBB5352294.1 STE24 endopeptidase [Haloferula luteola]